MGTTKKGALYNISNSSNPEKTLFLMKSLKIFSELSYSGQDLLYHSAVFGAVILHGVRRRLEEENTGTGHGETSIQQFL